MKKNINRYLCVLVIWSILVVITMIKYQECGLHNLNLVGYDG
jgi:hypothetical protein